MKKFEKRLEKGGQFTEEIIEKMYSTFWLLSSDTLGKYQYTDAGYNTYSSSRRRYSSFRTRGMKFYGENYFLNLRHFVKLLNAGKRSQI